MFKKNDIGKDYEDAVTFAKKHEWDLFNEWKRVTKRGRYSESYLLSDYRESIRNGIKHKTYDFHFVDPRLTKSGITDVAFYVLKYMMKGDGMANAHESKINAALRLNLSEEEYEKTWQMVKSRKRSSLNFGLDCWDEDNTPNPKIVDWIRQGIEQSKLTSDYPLYYCPEQIMTFPLAPYYKNKFFTYEDAIEWYYKKDHKGISIDGWEPREDKTLTEITKKFTEYERKLKIIKEDCFSQTLEELYND